MFKVISLLLRLIGVSLQTAKIELLPTFIKCLVSFTSAKKQYITKVLSFKKPSYIYIYFITCYRTVLKDVSNTLLNINNIVIS